VHVAAVRRKLGAAQAGADVRLPEIATVRGHGYRLELAASTQTR
jgi:DNA-binding response OmpR family regulator